MHCTYAVVQTDFRAFCQDMSVVAILLQKVTKKMLDWLDLVLDTIYFVVLGYYNIAVNCVIKSL